MLGDQVGTLHPTSPCGHREQRRGLLGAQTSPTTSGTPWCSDIANYGGDSSAVLGYRQLRRGLLGARTSLATPETPRCSDIASYVGDSSVLGHRQLRRGLLGARTSLATTRTPRCSNITSYAGDSSEFRFFVQASPTKLRTPLVVRSCYVSSV